MRPARGKLTGEITGFYSKLPLHMHNKYKSELFEESGHWEHTFQNSPDKVSAEKGRFKNSFSDHSNTVCFTAWNNFFRAHTGFNLVSIITVANICFVFENKNN